MKKSYSYNLYSALYSQCHVEFVTDKSSNEREKLYLIRFYS